MAYKYPKMPYNSHSNEVSCYNHNNNKDSKCMAKIWNEYLD